MQTPSFNQRPGKRYVDDYVDKTVLEDVNSVQRVIKVEKRTDNVTGRITFAFVQSVRFDTQGVMPYAVHPDVRDILVVSPEALVNFIQLLNGDKVWEELERLVPGFTSPHEK